MIRAGANIATLYRDEPQPLGVFETPVTEGRTVYCTVRSVSYRERYEAAAHGLKPDIIIRLAAPDEYRDEQRCVIRDPDSGKDVEFRVMHPWLNTRDGSVELTLERRAAP